MRHRRTPDMNSTNSATFLTEMFTRQIPQKLKSATVTITGIPKKNPVFFSGSFSRGDLASKSLLSVDTRRPLSENVADCRSKIPQNLKSARVQITYIPKTPQYFLVGRSNFGRNGRFPDLNDYLIGQGMGGWICHGSISSAGFPKPYNDLGQVWGKTLGYP